MLPTFNVPTNTSANPLQGSTSNLLPGEAVEPVAAFATEMKVYRAIPVTPPESGEWQVSGVVGATGDLLPDSGELSPLDGKDLPEDLRVMLAELREVGETGELAPTRGELPVQKTEGLNELVPDSDNDFDFPIYTGVDVKLPPGLALDSRITPEPSTGYLVGTGAITEATRSNAAPLPSQTALEPAAAASQPLTDRDAVIERLSQLAGVSATKLAEVAEQRDIKTADLQRITEFLSRRQAVSDQALATAVKTESLTAASTASTSVPVPAPLARIDGTILDGKGQRFRPLGVGQPAVQSSGESPVSRTVVELDMDIPEVHRASHTRADVLASEVLRQESMSNLKPAQGAFQVAAPQQGSASITTSQAYQPVDTAPKPLPGSIDVPVQNPSWGDRLNDRVVMMANNRLQNVDLRLSPAELGPLRVKVSVEDGTASVSFVAQHAVTRDAIEQALPRLKTLLEQNGIDLGDTSVDQQSPEQGMANTDRDGTGSAGQGDALEAGGSGRREDGQSDMDPRSGQAVRLSRGLLDTFA